MKIFTAIMMFVTLGIYAKAQTATSPEAKVVAEITGNRGVKNAPFSADAVSESVQILPDGNRIVRSSTSKMYRNSEGRFRQEVTGGSGGMLGSFYSFGDGISVFNPMGGSFSLDVGAKVARIFDGVAGQAVSMVAPTIAAIPKVVEAARLSDQVRAEIEALNGRKVTTSELSPQARAEIEKFQVEMDKLKGEMDKVKLSGNEIRRANEQLAATVSGGGMFTIAPSARSKWETRTEELGEQNIEGVNARGTRTITTIPAGAIGNERPIETVYEKWYSPELQMIVYSKHSDPRFGEQTYRLTNINRSEPDPSLFEVPSGYKKVSGGGQNTFTYSPTRAQQVDRAAGTRSATSVVSRTRPQQN